MQTGVAATARSADAESGGAKRCDACKFWRGYICRSVDSIWYRRWRSPSNGSKCLSYEEGSWREEEEEEDLRESKRHPGCLNAREQCDATVDCRFCGHNVWEAVRRRRIPLTRGEDGLLRKVIPARGPEREREAMTIGH